MAKIVDVRELTKMSNATALISEFKDSTDPAYIGPGTWNVIHRLAIKAITHSQQLDFIVFMKDICYGFPCIICRGHCTEYIKNHPMELYLDVVIKIGGLPKTIGLFVWSWKFHNVVNAKLKKPIMSWDTAYNLYSSDQSLVCSKTCLESANLHTDDIADSKDQQTIKERFRLISSRR